MRKLFTVVLIVAVALAAGNAAAQSGSTLLDKETLKKLTEFISNKGSKENPTVKQPAKGPVNPTAAKPDQPQKPIIQPPVKPVQPPVKQQTTSFLSTAKFPLT